MAFETELDPEIPLPPLQVATLDEATLGQLFFDVAHAAELLGVTFKGGATAHAHESADPGARGSAYSSAIDSRARRGSTR
jgi:hypothetical protein